MKFLIICILLCGCQERQQTEQTEQPTVRVSDMIIYVDGTDLTCVHKYGGFSCNWEKYNKDREWKL